MSRILNIYDMKVNGDYLEIISGNSHATEKGQSSE